MFFCVPNWSPFGGSLLVAAAAMALGGSGGLGFGGGLRFDGGGGFGCSSSEAAAKHASHRLLRQSLISFPHEHSLTLLSPC
jgi:hypothetical protein